MYEVQASPHLFQHLFSLKKYCSHSSGCTGQCLFDSCSSPPTGTFKYPTTQMRKWAIREGKLTCLGHTACNDQVRIWTQVCWFKTKAPDHQANCAQPSLAAGPALDVRRDRKVQSRSWTWKSHVRPLSLCFLICQREIMMSAPQGPWNSPWVWTAMWLRGTVIYWGINHCNTKEAKTKLKRLLHCFIGRQTVRQIDRIFWRTALRCGEYEKALALILGYKEFR